MRFAYASRRSVITMSQREAAVLKKVAIIGGGYAGIAAARTLVQRGGGAVSVELFEAGPVLGGRARQGTLPVSGLPVELGATWFHGTQDNPVYDLAVKHGIVNPSLHETPQQPQQQQQDEDVSTLSAAAATSTDPADPSAAVAAASSESSSSSAAGDSTGNAAGGDSDSEDEWDARWEMLLCAPGCSQPLSGPHKAAALAAFQQYSEAVEEAAAAAAGGNASADQAQQLGQEMSCGAASSSSGSLGWHLRGRFDQVMQQQQQQQCAVVADTADLGSSTQQQQQHQHQQHQQQQQQLQQLQLDHGEGEEQPTAAAAAAAETADGVSAWLASDSAGSLKSAFTQGWACRERLQRAYEGFHSTDAAGTTHALEYTDLDGPNVPVPGGYQHLAEVLAAEAEVQGVNFTMNCPVQKILWQRLDGKVAIQLPAAAAAFSSCSSAATTAPDGQVSAAVAGAEITLRLFDAVVFTGSLGVLKAQAGQLFDPPLPAAKAAAIQQLHIGQVEKLFVEWPAAAAAAAGDAAAAPVQPTAAAAAGGGGSIGQQRLQAPQHSSTLAPRHPATSVAAVAGPRKPKTQLHDFSIEAPAVGDAYKAATASCEAQGCDSATAAADVKQANSSNSSSRFTTYCLLWPSKEELWTRQWLAQQQQQQQCSLTQVLAPDVPVSDPVYVDCFGVNTNNNSGGSSSSRTAAPSITPQQQQQQAGALPTWLLGLHSWRYGDGPEWIKPPHIDSSSSSIWQQQQQGSPERCAVVWVTGRAAAQLQQLSDAQVLQHLQQLLDTFPAIPRPELTHQAGPEGSREGPDSAQADALAGPGSSTDSVQEAQGVAAAQAGPEGSPEGPDSAPAGPDVDLAVLLSSGSISSTEQAQARPEEGATGPDSVTIAQASSSLAGCRLLRSSWTTSEQFLGSYSYPRPAASGETAEVLAQPLYAADAATPAQATSIHSVDGQQQQQCALVCFAGEATSRQYMGTVHGAFMSGEREAERLLAQWGLA